jgi:hypothetical protein
VILASDIDSFVTTTSCVNLLTLVLYPRDASKLIYYEKVLSTPGFIDMMVKLMFDVSLNRMIPSGELSGLSLVVFTFFHFLEFEFCHTAPIVLQVGGMNSIKPLLNHSDRDIKAMGYRLYTKLAVFARLFPKLDVKCGINECRKTGKMKCGKCRMMSYCSVECQKLDWVKHKVHCKEDNLDRWREERQDLFFNTFNKKMYKLYLPNMKKAHDPLKFPIYDYDY